MASTPFGFRTIRSAGRVELARLELGGLQPVVEGKRAKVLQVVKEANKYARVRINAVFTGNGAGAELLRRLA